MSKRNKIIYWISTLWLSLGMLSSGLVQLIQHPEEVKHLVDHLGYPLYFLPLLGAWKFAGVLAILIPGRPLVKEWAYAGFFFTMTGALYSHVACKDEAYEYFGPTLSIILIFVSWYFRPDSRKIQIQPRVSNV